MTPHAWERLSERTPWVNGHIMQKAVNRFIRDGVSDTIELVKKTSTGNATIYRYTPKFGAIVYPLAIPDGQIVTIYTQQILSKKKASYKFKKRVLRSRSHWKGKLKGGKPTARPPAFDDST